MQHRVVGSVLPGFRPDTAGFVLVTLHPHDLAQVRPDLAIAGHVPGLLQVVSGLFQPAQPVMNPAHAVDDRRIVRFEVEGLLDIPEGFIVAVSPVCQRVAKGIHRPDIIRVELEDAAHVLLRQIDTVYLLRCQGTAVEQVFIVAVRGKRLVVELPRLVIERQVGEYLPLDEIDLDGAVRIVATQALHVLPDLVEPALLHQYLGRHWSPCRTT